MSQRVLVTAGGSGIGQAIAEAFYGTGARVQICDLDQASLDRFIGRCPRVRAAHTDVSDQQQVANMFRELRDAWGGLDVLVNNAGIGGPRAPMDAISIDDWRRSLDVNLTGPFITMQEAIPGMREQGRGCIINIVTTSTFTGLPNRMPYVASKWGLRGLTMNAARELGPSGIRVNGVFPGMVDNPRGRMLIEKLARESGVPVARAEEQALSFVSMRTWIQPEDVAELCVFLASDKARHISGQEISVDGNMEWEA